MAELANLRIKLKEFNAGAVGARLAAAGNFQHRDGNIDSDDPPTGAYLCGEFQRRVAAAAADVQHALARCWREPSNCCLSQRRYLLVQGVMVTGPGEASRGIPVLGLTGVVGIGCSQGRSMGLNRVADRPE